MENFDLRIYLNSVINNNKNIFNYAINEEIIKSVLFDVFKQGFDVAQNIVYKQLNLGD